MSLLLAISLASAAAPTTDRINDDRAVDMVAEVMRQWEPAMPTRCLSFGVEGDAYIVDIEVRENHKPGCGGDPGIAPLIGSFQIDRSPLRLRVFDLIQAEYVPCRLSTTLKPECPRN